MHYYKHHIGDYRRDTSHLTLLEHGVFRQLLDWYYLDESAIPLETHSVYRRLGARTEIEQNAVDSVLNDFFEKTDCGWVNKRCNLEIADYQGVSAVNRVNGKLGGRPKKTHSVIDGLANGKRSESENNPNHKPLTINHKETKGDKSPFVLPEQIKPEVWKDWHDYRNTKKGWTAKAKQLSLNTLLKLAEKGHDPKLIIETSIERGWTGLFEPKPLDKPVVRVNVAESKPETDAEKARRKLDEKAAWLLQMERMGVAV